MCPLWSTHCCLHLCISDASIEKGSYVQLSRDKEKAEKRVLEEGAASLSSLRDQWELSWSVSLPDKIERQTKFGS